MSQQRSAEMSDTSRTLRPVSAPPRPAPRSAAPPVAKPRNEPPRAAPPAPLRSAPPAVPRSAPPPPVRSALPPVTTRSAPPPLPRRPSTTPRAVDPAHAATLPALTPPPLPPRELAVTIDASELIDESESELRGVSRTEPPPVQLPRRSSFFHKLTSGAAIVGALVGALFVAEHFKVGKASPSAAALAVAPRAPSSEVAGSSTLPATGEAAHLAAKPPQAASPAQAKLHPKPEHRASSRATAKPAAPKKKSPVAAKPKKKPKQR